MPAAMRVKVDRLALIDKIKTKLAEAEIAHGAKVAEYNDALAVYNGAMKEVGRLVAAELSEAAKAARRGDLPSKEEIYRKGRYRQFLLVPAPAFPDKPSKPEPFDSSRFDRDIALLEMSPEETLSISTESDFARYL